MTSFQIKSRIRVFALALTVFFCHFSFLSLASADQIQYFYDDAGRLQWVQKGQEIRYYAYDEVGNLLSIVAAHAFPPVIQSMDPDVLIIGNSYDVTISGQNLLTVNSITSDSPSLAIKIQEIADTSIRASVTIGNNASPGQSILLITTSYGSVLMPVSICRACVSPEAIGLSPGGSASFSVTLNPAASKAATSSIFNQTPGIISMPSSILVPAGGAGHFTVNAISIGAGLLSVGSTAVSVTVDAPGESVSSPVSVFIESGGNGAGVSGPVSVMLDTSPGNGTAVSSPVSVSVYPATVTPAAYDFGTMNIGSNSSQTFTITNAGTSNIQSGTVAITGNDSPEFSVINNNCAGKTLSAGQSCTFQVVFSPVSVGSKSAGVSVLFLNPGSLVLNAHLSGSARSADQTVTFEPIQDKTLDNAPFTLIATASSDLPVSFISLTPEICSVLDSTVTLLHIGTCTIRASRSGNAEYNPAPDVDQSFNVNKANQTITATTQAPATAVYGTNFTVAATASSGLTVAITTSGVCSGSGTGSAIITMTSGTGACTVSHSQSGNSSYNAAPSVGSATAAVRTAQAAVAVSVPATATYAQTGLYATASGGSGTGAFSFSAAGSTACTVDAVTGAITVTSGTGTCSITVSKAGDSNYLPATSAPAISHVNKATPVIQWSNAADIISGTPLGAIQLNAAASFGGVPLAGAFSYTPVAGTVLNPGSSQPLSVSFTPDDTTDFNNASASVIINVTDFSFSPVSAVSMDVASSTTVNITVNELYGFNASVALGTTGLPAGVSASFSPNSVNLAGGAVTLTLTISLDPTVTPSTFTFQITGTSGPLSHSINVSVTVNASFNGINSAINQMTSSGNITSIATALISKLSAAQTAAASGNTQTAINNLNALLNQISAQSGKHVTVTAAAGLSKDITTLINDLGGH